MEAEPTCIKCGEEFYEDHEWMFDGHGNKIMVCEDCEARPDCCLPGGSCIDYDE